MPEIELLAVVAVLEDIPPQGLLRGQVGTLVERLAPDVYEVEFSDDSGRTYASLALRVDQLMRLHYLPSTLCVAHLQRRLVQLPNAHVRL